ncbi:MAG: ion channel [Thermodesulfobacteriota bacterium]
MEPSRLRAAYREWLKALKETYFFRLAALMLIILYVAAMAMFLFEHSGDSYQGLWDSLWWAMVTVTTVGYGDIVPKTVIGRLIGFTVMISGLFLISMLTATIASVFVSRKIKEGKGLEDIRERSHIVICGWNYQGYALIQGLYHQFKPKVPLIVLVNELPREEVDAILYRFQDVDFKYVRGNFTKEEILGRANVKHARAAIILSDSSGSHPYEKADERTIFGCLAIKSMSPAVKTCAELRDPENKEHLLRANVDEIVVRGEYNAAILAGAAAASGLSTVVKSLFDVNEPNKLWRTKIHERFVGQPLSELAEHIRTKYSAILLAIVTETDPIRLEDILSPDASAIDQFIKRKFEESGKDYFSSNKKRVAVQLNPPHDYMITPHDAAIVLGRNKPGEASILEKSLDLVR